MLTLHRQDTDCTQHSLILIRDKQLSLMLHFCLILIKVNCQTSICLAPRWKGHYIMPSLKYPVLVISYCDNTRGILTQSLQNLDIPAVSCSLFSEAEDLALQSSYHGILVDLPSIIKAKGDEKAIAYTLTNFYPTLKVRNAGSVLVPMSMPGEAKQDSSINDFILNTCKAFKARKLRSNRRRETHLSTVRKLDGTEERHFTLNVSWGGAFIINSNPEKFRIGDEFELFFHELGFEVAVVVCWIQHWGERRVPGIGIRFLHVDEKLEQALFNLLKNDKHADRDRIKS